MNKRDLKFWLAPFGVAIGISVFIAVSVLIVSNLGISNLQKIFTFIPYVVFIIVGIVLVAMWLPIFLLGIYYLGRQGAVGQSEQLKTQGIYQFVRNPMYSGISLTLVGVGLILTNTGVVLAGVLWLAITFVQCKREESELAGRFGDAYIEYKKSTPMFLPDFVKLLKGIRR